MIDLYRTFMYTSLKKEIIEMQQKILCEVSGDSDLLNDALRDASKTEASSKKFTYEIALLQLWRVDFIVHEWVSVSSESLFLR